MSNHDNDSDYDEVDYDDSEYSDEESDEESDEDSDSEEVDYDDADDDSDEDSDDCEEVAYDEDEDYPWELRRRSSRCWRSGFSSWLQGSSSGSSAAGLPRPPRKRSSARREVSRPVASEEAAQTGGSARGHPSAHGARIFLRMIAVLTYAVLAGLLALSTHDSCGGGNSENVNVSGSRSSDGSDDRD